MMNGNRSVPPFLSEGLMRRKERGNMRTSQSPKHVGSSGNGNL